MRVLDGVNGWLEPIVISADNRRIAAADRKQRGIRLFDLAAGSMHKPYKTRVDDICFYPDANRVVLAAGDDLLLHDWDAGTTKTIAKAWGSGMVVTPGGELVTLGVQHVRTEKAVVIRWAVGADGRIGRVAEAKTNSSTYSHLRLWPDGSRVIAVLRTPTHTDARGVVLGVPDFEVVGEFAIPTDWPGEIVVAPGGNQFAARYRRTIFIWAGPDWKTFREIKLGGRRDLTGLAYHPSGKHFAAACNDETVRVYDTTTWAEVKKYTWKSGRLRSVAYSPDGTLAAAGTDTGKVVVWDVDE